MSTTGGTSNSRYTPNCSIVATTPVPNQPGEPNPPEIPVTSTETYIGSTIEPESVLLTPGSKTALTRVEPPSARPDEILAISLLDEDSSTATPVDSISLEPKIQEPEVIAEAEAAVVDGPAPLILEQTESLAIEADGPAAIIDETILPSPILSPALISDSILTSHSPESPALSLVPSFVPSVGPSEGCDNDRLNATNLGPEKLSPICEAVERPNAAPLTDLPTPSPTSSQVPSTTNHDISSNGSMWASPPSGLSSIHLSTHASQNIATLTKGRPNRKRKDDDSAEVDDTPKRGARAEQRDNCGGQGDHGPKRPRTRSKR